MPSPAPSETKDDIMERLFSDEPSPQPSDDPQVRPEDRVEPEPNVKPTPEPDAKPTPEPKPEADPFDTMMDRIEPGVPAPKPDEGLLSLPDEHDDTITPEARKVIEKYAYESRELNRRIKALESKPPENTSSPEEVTTLKSRVEELEGEIGRLDLARSPSFQQQYDEPIQQITRKAGMLLQRAGVPEDQVSMVLDKVLATTDLRQRELAFDDLDVDVSQNVVAGILTASIEYDDLTQTKENALKEWKTSKAAVEERSRQERQARDTKDVKQLMSHATSTVREENNPFLLRVEGNDKWNSEVVDHYEDALSGVLQRNDQKEIAKLVLNGLTFSPLLTRFAAERSRRQALERSLGSDTAPHIPAPGRPNDVAPRQQPKPTEVLTSKQAIDKVFGPPQAY